MIVRGVFILGLSIFCLALGASRAWAQAQNQMHFRTGMVTGSLGAALGEKAGAIAVAPSFDFEYESFISDRKSLIVHGVLAFEMATAVTRYMFGGAGYRYYIGARGSPLISAGTDATVVVRPTSRTYVGWEVGLSQAVLIVNTASLQTVTSAIDGGGYVGWMKQMGNAVSFDAQFGMNYVFGFSSVSAGGMIMKMMFGMAYNF